VSLQKRKKPRNKAYLKWLDEQKCCALNDFTQEGEHTHHHVRIGNDAGMGQKPSDYRCIPLHHRLHTGTINAIHNIGEDKFFRERNLDPDEIIINLLLNYIKERHPAISYKKIIEFIEDTIEEDRT